MKSDPISTFSPSVCHEVIGLDAMILVFWMLSFKPAFPLSPFAFTITRLFWGALHGMAHSFIELDKAVVCVIKLSSFLWLWFTHANYFITSFKILLLLSCSIVSDSLKPCRLQHARLPCPSPSPRVSWNSCSLSWWWHPTVSSSVAPFYSCP